MRRRALLTVVTIALLQIACGLISTPTPVTIVKTAEVEVTRQVTREVIVTVTPEPTPAATPEPRVLFEDDFETGDGEWSIEESPEGSIHIRDGQLIIEVQSSRWNMYANHPKFQLLDTYVLDVDISYVAGPTETEAGIAFRCNQEGEEWLQVSIDANGFFSVARITDQDTELQTTEVVPWVRTAAVLRGQAINHIRLIDNSRKVTVYVNEELVTTLPYDAVAPGCPYPFVGTFDQGEAMWAFDNVAVREIEP